MSARTCAHCEYFDGGGEAAVLHAIKSGEILYGDCLNNASPRFETVSVDTCPCFTPTSTPLEEEPRAEGE